MNSSVLKKIAGLSDNDDIHDIKWLQYNSCKFRSGLLILHNTFLYEIEKMMIVNDEYYIFCFQYKKVDFDKFLNSVKVEQVEPKRFALIKFDSLQKKKLYEKKSLDGDFYVIADTLDLKF